MKYLLIFILTTIAFPAAAQEAFSSIEPVKEPVKDAQKCPYINPDNHLCYYDPGISKLAEESCFSDLSFDRKTGIVCWTDCGTDETFCSSYVGDDLYQLEVSDEKDPSRKFVIMNYKVVDELLEAINIFNPNGTKIAVNCLFESGNNKYVCGKESDAHGGLFEESSARHARRAPGKSVKGFAISKVFPIPPVT